MAREARRHNSVQPDAGSTASNETTNSKRCVWVEGADKKGRSCSGGE